MSEYPSAWPNPGICEHCDGSRQDEPELSWLIVYNFDGWVCDYCRDILMLEE